MTAPPAVDTDSLAEICRLNTRITELERLLAAEQQLNRELTEAARTARNYADSVAAGYIDHTFLNRGTQ
ncbi:hypothetical protein SUDANB1_07107 [Streptomyces sp. enrichment culture]|uniref:hypothetical protein n=1 Tax=Streptomyces sp. enrichment culture TaxID=1795815 RepID=UPI003F57DC96